MEENKDNLSVSEELPEETVNEEIIEVIPEEITEESASEETTEEVTDEEAAVVTVNTAIEDKSGKKNKEEKKKKGTAGKIFKWLGILLFTAFMVFSGYVGYRVWEYLQVYVYTTQHTVPATFENETISLTLENAEIIDEIIGFEMDENYVYVGVKYTVTNKTEAPIEWKAFPLLMVKEYIRDEEDTGYILVENTDQGYEMAGLRNYAINLELDLRPAKDNLEAGQSRTTADIFKIAKADYEAKKYFLTTDLFNEIIILPELPAPESDTVTDTVTDTAE